MRCDRCGRAGWYRVATLVETYGLDAGPPDIASALEEVRKQGCHRPRFPFSLTPAAPRRDYHRVRHLRTSLLDHIAPPTPPNRAGGAFSLTAPPARCLLPLLVVLHDVIGEAHGEAGLVAEVDERLDLGGDDGLGAVDAAVADADHLACFGIGHRLNWGEARAGALGHARQSRPDHRPLRLAQVPALDVEVDDEGLESVRDLAPRRWAREDAVKRDVLAVVGNCRERRGETWCVGAAS